MSNKTYKFVTILMVMLLVLGLALAACKAPAKPVTPPTPPAATPPAATPPVTPPAATPPATPPAAAPAAGPTSYPAATYTNDTYGFSIQYPKDWVARPEIMTTPEYLAVFGVSGFVPGIAILAYDADAPESADWIVATFKKSGNVDPKVKSDIKEETLAGGTKAYTYQAAYISATGYDIISYCLDADKDGKRIRINIFTIDAFAPYDAKLASEIAHTLTFK
ncbi:MAG: hypothetical protein WCD72_06150 [Dehalococcoidia bacterium]